MNENPSHPSGPKKCRSRGACRECRRLHRKCDEALPTCHNCALTGKTCSYIRDLSWGGRPFQRSRFGRLVDSRVIKLTTVSTGSVAELNGNQFVYGVSRVEGPPTQGQPESFSPQDVSESVKTISKNNGPPHGHPDVLANPQWNQHVPKEQRHLLHHFVERFTCCFSSHVVLHERFGLALVPMAMDDTYGNQLLFAMLYVGAVHEASLAHREVDCQWIGFKYKSIQILGRQKLGEDALRDDVSIATALVLCLSELTVGGERPHSWRMHLRGAAAMFETASSSPSAGNWKSTSTRSFLLRWLSSFERLTLSVSQSLRIEHKNPVGHHTCTDKGYIDLFDAFSNTLVPLLEEIDQLCKDKDALRDIYSNKTKNAQAVWILETDLIERAGVIAQQIQGMLANPAPTLDPWLQVFTSDDQTISEYNMVNQAYHYAALLQLYQQIMEKSAEDPDVVYTVDRMAKCLSRLPMKDGSCPAVATLYPVFIMGCNTHDAASRMWVFEWLNNMRKQFGLTNVDRAREFLVELWQVRDRRGGTQPYLKWDDFQRAKNWDLLLY